MTKNRRIVRFAGLFLAALLVLGLGLSQVYATETDSENVEKEVITLKGTNGDPLEGVQIDFVLGKLTKETIIKEAGQTITNKEYDIIQGKNSPSIVLNSGKTDKNGQVNLNDFFNFADKKIKVANDKIYTADKSEFTLEEIVKEINAKGLAKDELINEDLYVLAVVRDESLAEAGARPEDWVVAVEYNVATSDKVYSNEYYNEKAIIEASAYEEADKDKEKPLEEAKFSLSKAGTTSLIAPTETLAEDGKEVKGVNSFEVHRDSFSLVDGKLDSDLVLRQAASKEGLEPYPEAIELKGEVKEGKLVSDKEDLEVLVKFGEGEAKTTVTGIEVKVVNKEKEVEPDQDDQDKETPKTVVLASGDNYADALAAGPLAIQKDARILLTGKTLNPDVKDELARLEAEKVIIVGGASWIPTSLENDLLRDGYLVKRIAGANKYETSVKVAQELGAKKAVLAHGTNPADALAVSGYAAKNDMAILLTDTKALAKEVDDYIKTIDQVEIVGGPNAISTDIEKSLGNKFARRIEGENRFETATRLAVLTYPDAEDFVLVNASTGLVDALSAAPFAYEKEAPILLTEAGNMHPTSQNYLNAKDADEVEISIIGGVNSVSQAIQDALAGRYGQDDVSRISGDNKYDTSVQVSKALDELVKVEIEEEPVSQVEESQEGDKEEAEGEGQAEKETND